MDTPIGVYQLEWGASIRYYADRRVLALPDPDAVRAFFRSWPYGYVFMLRQDQESVRDSQHDLHEVAAAEAIVGRTGRYLRRQVWGAVTVVSRHTRGPRQAPHGLNSFGPPPTTRPQEAAEGEAWVLVSRVRNSLTFSGRGIPAGGVAPPLHTPGMLGRRALPSGRRAPENMSPNFRLGTLALLPLLDFRPRRPATRRSG